MADRESLLREAQRKQQALLAERTSPDAEGTPSLDAWFDPVPQTLDGAVDSVAAVLRALSGQNDYIQSWRVVRSAADHDAATGLDVVADPAAFSAYLRAEKQASDADYSFSVLAFSTLIFPDDPRTYSASLNYSGGMTPRRSDKAAFLTTGQHTGDTLSFAQWVRMIETLLGWRSAKYIAVGPYSYGIHNRVFGHRAWQGWMGWFPQEIDASALPGFAIVQQVGSGTLVASQDHTVRADDPAAIERANQLEIALAELGVLPTLNSL